LKVSYSLEIYGIYKKVSQNVEFDTSWALIVVARKLVINSHNFKLQKNIEFQYIYAFYFKKWIIEKLEKKNWMIG